MPCPNARDLPTPRERYDSRTVPWRRHRPTSFLCHLAQSLPSEIPSFFPQSPHCAATHSSPRIAVGKNQVSTYAKSPRPLIRPDASTQRSPPKEGTQNRNNHVLFWLMGNEVANRENHPPWRWRVRFRSTGTTATRVPAGTVIVSVGPRAPLNRTSHSGPIGAGAELAVLQVCCAKAELDETQ